LPATASLLEGQNVSALLLAAGGGGGGGGGGAASGGAEEKKGDKKEEAKKEEVRCNSVWLLAVLCLSHGLAHSQEPAAEEEEGDMGFSLFD
jgi:ribosomal protein L12E/L44/L45/RPP1/RPP2